MHISFANAATILALLPYTVLLFWNGLVLNKNRLVQQEVSTEFAVARFGNSAKSGEDSLCDGVQILPIDFVLYF